MVLTIDATLHDVVAEYREDHIEQNNYIRML